MNVSNGSVGAGQDNNGLRATCDDGGSREEHVDLVLKDSALILDNGFVILADTLALAGQDGLVDGEAVALDCNDTAVCRDAVSDRNGDDVAGNQLLGLYSGDVAAITDNIGLVGRVLLQGGNCLLGATFLRDADDGIEDEDGENLDA